MTFLSCSKFLKVMFPCCNFWWIFPMQNLRCNWITQHCKKVWVVVQPRVEEKEEGRWNKEGLLKRPTDHNSGGRVSSEGNGPSIFFAIICFCRCFLNSLQMNYQPSFNCILWPGSQKFTTAIAAFFRIFTPVPQTWPNKCSCGLGLVHIPSSLSVSCYFTLIHLMHIKGIKALCLWNKNLLTISSSQLLWKCRERFLFER